MALNVVATGKLTIPLEDGQAPAPIDLGFNFIFTQRISDERVYSGSVADDVVSLGTMASGGARLLLVKSPIGGCTIKINGGATAFAVPPGAYLLYANPSGGFVTSLTVTTTGAATVKIVALA